MNSSGREDYRPLRFPKAVARAQHSLESAATVLETFPLKTPIHKMHILRIPLFTGDGEMRINVDAEAWNM